MSKSQDVVRSFINKGYAYEMGLSQYEFHLLQKLADLGYLKNLFRFTKKELIRLTGMPLGTIKTALENLKARCLIFLKCKWARRSSKAERLNHCSINIEHIESILYPELKLPQVLNNEDPVDNFARSENVKAPPELLDELLKLPQSFSIDTEIGFQDHKKQLATSSPAIAHNFSYETLDEEDRRMAEAKGINLKRFCEHFITYKDGIMLKRADVHAKFKEWLIKEEPLRSKFKQQEIRPMAKLELASEIIERINRGIRRHEDKTQEEKVVSDKIFAEYRAQCKQALKQRSGILDGVFTNQ